MKRNPVLIRLFGKSMARQLLGGMLLCLLILLLLATLLNRFALVPYYRQVKQTQLTHAFQEVSALAAAENEESLVTRLEQLRNNDSIGTVLWSRTGVFYDYRTDRYRTFFPSITGETGSYSVEIRREPHTDTAFLTLYGITDDGRFVMMQSSLQAIQDSVGVVNTFLLFSGAVSLVASVLLAVLFSRRLSRPLEELSQAAGCMARLDFSQRYSGGGSSEIEALGNSLNTMADALETTVSGLKEANRQLALDNEEKTVQDTARRAFIANVSHELKTPIALIQTYAEGLREGLSESVEDRDYYCRVIEEEAQKMTALIRKMTALMQLESGAEPLTPESLDVTELLRGLFQKFRPRFEEQQAVAVPPPPEPVYIFADGLLLEEVFSNFLSNALRHVSPGGEVRSTVERTPEGRVRISVFNTGEPIPAEALPHIWESFYRADAARSRQNGGTGIGLAVVAAIMRAHGQPYGVRNREAGVEFYVELPPAKG